MRAHSDIFHIYTNFTNTIYTQFNKHIKVFQFQMMHMNMFLHQCKTF